MAALRMFFLCVNFLIFISFSVYSQGRQTQGQAATHEKDSVFIDKIAKDDFDRTNRSLYAMGAELNDAGMKQRALENLLAHNQADSMVLLGLLDIYFTNKAYQPCFLLSKKYLLTDRENVALLDYYSKSAELLNRYADALIGYKKLYFLTDYVFYGYLAANTEFLLGKYNDSKASALEVLSDFEKHKDQKDIYEFVTFVEKDGNQQNVKIKAALYNLLGENQMMSGAKEDAKNAFTRALTEFPDFIDARTNLDAVSH